MEEIKYLGLSDLLDGDISSYEYFVGLPLEIKSKLEANDDITTFSELQKTVRKYMKSDL